VQSRNGAATAVFDTIANGLKMASLRRKAPSRHGHFVMKKIAILVAGLIAAPQISIAADMMSPVREIMDATVKNWGGSDSDWVDIFDEAKLAGRYSKDFIAKYQAAAQNPAADEDGISPFDYDVIVNGQDACPLEGLSIVPQPANGATTEVIAKFKTSTCMEGVPDPQVETVVRFEVMEEGGKPVVDDIITEGEAGQPPNSLKQTMVSIAKGE
jgi:hypothetical protein